VPEAIARALKLHGHRRLAALWRVETGTAIQHVVDHLLSDEQRQELVQDHPVVVPGGELAGNWEGVPRHFLHAGGECAAGAGCDDAGRARADLAQEAPSVVPLPRNPGS
jgi:hypothetical protein